MILVTGATGGFGRILSRWLETNGTTPVTRTGGRESVERGYVSCDMRDATAVKALIRRCAPSTVYHLAGSLGNDFDASLAINALSAKHILDALEESGIGARVILIGSAAEYGIVEAGENPIGEGRALRPVSTYGLTKAFQTQIAMMYAHRGVDVVVARIFNLLGPGLTEKLFVGRVEKLIGQFKRGEVGTIALGNLEAQRDYVAIDEAIAQITAIAARGRAGEVYHIGSGRPVSMRHLLGQLLKEAGLDTSVVTENDPSIGRSKYDVPIVYADMSKTRALLDDAR